MNSCMATCSICGGEIGDKSTVCAACGVTYHVDCWGYNGGCATFGCGSDKKDDAPDKKSRDKSKGGMSGLELTVSSSSSPAVPEENDFVKRFVEPVYQDIITLLEETPNKDKTDHALLYTNAIRRVMSPPVVLRRLEKIRSDWVEHYQKRLEERCGQDQHFQLVKEDPAYLLRTWGEFRRYFEPLRGWVGQIVDARSAIIKNPAPKEFFETLNLLDNIDKSLQMGSISQPISQLRDYAKRSGKLSSKRIKDEIIGDVLCSAVFGLCLGLSPLMATIMSPPVVPIMLVGLKNAYRSEAQSSYGDYFSIEQNIRKVVPKLQVLYPSKDSCPSAARTMNQCLKHYKPPLLQSSI